MPFSAQQMYELINDIDNYPKFLPWCSATKVHTRAATTLEATIHIVKGPINYTITTENTMREPESIIMQYKTGPFKHCLGTWQFKAQNCHNTCEVIFNMEYEFKNKLTAIALEPFFNPVANTLIDSFCQRARELYG